jgi:site-specific recombinase XerC
MTFQFQTHDHAPFANAGLDSLPSASAVERLILQSGLKGSQDRVVSAGQLLTVATTFGALLNPAVWPSWLASLSQGMRANDDGLWVELNHEHAHLPLRWFADPLTETLLRRLQNEGPWSLSGLCPRRCMAKYLKVIGLAEADVASAQLEHIVEIRWRLRMPALLVEAAKGNIDSRSVPAEQWRRIIRSELATKRDAAGRSPPPQETAPVAPTPESWTSTYAVATALEQARRWSGTRRQWLRKAEARVICLPAVEAVKRDDAKSPFLERALNGWVLARLSGNSDQTIHSRRNAVSPGWLRQQLQYIGPVLEHIAMISGQDGADLNSEIIADAYRRAIRAENPQRVQVKTLSALTSFQDHLETLRPDICVLFDEYEDVSRGEENVSTHLVSPAVYGAAHKRLAGSEPIIWSRRLYLTLGFRAGLRREEAEALLVSDFFRTGTRLELRIRANPHFTLKSPAARRRIPLHTLLSAEELADLIAWLQRRERECGGFSQRALLFCRKEHPANRLSRKDLDEPVVNLLRELTANPVIVYHHLRHSFATHALACLLLPEDHPKVECPAGFDEETISGSRRHRVIASLAGPGSSGQFSVDALGTVLGHRDNNTTFLWYIHLLDWSVGQHVRRPGVQTGLSAEALEAFIGVSATSIRRRMISAECGGDGSRTRRKRGRRRLDEHDPGTAFVDTFLRDVRRKWPIQEEFVARRSASASGRAEVTRVSATEDWRTLSGALSAMDRGSLPHEVAERFGLDEDECARIAQDADLVSSIVTPTGRRRFRFAGWIDASKRERAEAPGLKILHRGRERARRRRRSEIPVSPTVVAARKRLIGGAVRDVQRMDRLWPIMIKRREHPWTRWTLRQFLKSYSEARGLIFFRRSRDAARYVRGLLLLGIEASSIQVRPSDRTTWEQIAVSTDTKMPSLTALHQSIEDVCIGSGTIHVRVTRSPDHVSCSAVAYLLLLLAMLSREAVSLDLAKRPSSVLRERFEFAPATLSVA